MVNRKPVADPFAWWRVAALSDTPPKAFVDEPQSGYYRRRLVKGGPWVPVKIWLIQIVDPETGELTQPSYFCCDVDGKPASAEDQWSYVCDQPITRADYDHMVDVSKYAKARDPREPLADPRKKVNLMNVPFPTFQKPKGKKP